MKYAVMTMSHQAVRKYPRRDKAGISPAVVTLIILVIGVAIAIVVMGIATGFVTAWGGAARVTIERADITVDPSSGHAYITVDIRNSGGSKLTVSSIELMGVTLSGSWSPDPSGGDLTLNPGQSISFTASDDGTNVEAGKTYVVKITCTDPAGNEVSDQRSVLAHI